MSEEIKEYKRGYMIEGGGVDMIHQCPGDAWLLEFFHEYSHHYDQQNKMHQICMKELKTTRKMLSVIVVIDAVMQPLGEDEEI